eukprot:6075597-Lingulodinium_polyedra.AAC.1
MRSNQPSAAPSAAATTCKSHARALHARACFLARARAHGGAQTCDLQTAATTDGRFDRIVVQRF